MLVSIIDINFRNGALQDAANALIDVSSNEQVNREWRTAHERWFNHVRNILRDVLGARLLLNFDEFFRKLALE